MDNKVVCVVGPTACGKTKMGVVLAKRFGGEVVSVDSMQLYRGMTIGTAAPTAKEMEGVPHHMVAVADPAESWSVARYVREADACVQDILRRGKRPVLVGGTGLYLDALVRGQDFAAGSQGGEIRRELQERLAKDGAEALLEALRALGQETELILSDWGAETIRLETDLTVEQVKALADRVYDNRNMAAQAASGSSCADAMVIAPCSMKTLAGIAMGYDDSLLVRAADVMLKERRRLILLTRETPLNLSHIRNMETVTLMGGIILPPVPAFYSRPQTVDDIVDQTVSRTLRLLGLDGGERFRWNGNG